jgi:hypothetical protein
MTHSGKRSAPFASCIVGVFTVVAAAAPVGMAIAQTAQPAQPSAASAQPPQHGVFPAQPAPSYKPGFIYAFGRWWDSARLNLNDLTKHSRQAANATQDAMRNAAQATRDAANVLVRLPRARVLEVHERCSLAPNGAPDCRSAASNVCRAKGFTNGNPVNVQSSENCPPAVWMSGRVPSAGECPQETVVLLAACD